MSWIAVKLDGTLARHEGKGPEHIGEPLLPMWERVQEWASQGRDVRVLTTRRSPSEVALVREWLRKHNLGQLVITDTTDAACSSIYADDVHRVGFNTGETCCEITDLLREENTLLKAELHDMRNEVERLRRQL